MERFEEIKLGACSHWSNAPYKEEVEKGYVSGTALARKIALRAFASGAEWADAHPKNPWISVKDRLPNDNELVLCRMKSNGAIVNGYIFISPDGYPCVSTLPDFEFEDYGGYVCDMWMPIPPFDEILEANKDVLHRIKENGD